MTVSSFYNGLISNMFMGGIAAILIIAAMFWKANKIAASGNKAKMFSWSVAPAIMVVIAVIAHGVALNIIWPKIQGAFTSTPVQNMVATGGALATAADGVLWGNGNGEMMASFVGPNAFKAPVMEASNVGPLVNGGQTASFVSQPVNIQANTERTVETAAQAVNAITNIAATATPIGGGQAYINQFIADNKPVDTTISCNGSYTVKSGDSLAKIAKACYGDSNKWVELCNANRGTVADCNNIKSGMTLVIPSGNSSLPTSAVVNSQAPATFGQQSATYNVKPTPAPVYANQGNQQAAAPVRNVASGQVVITNNAAAVQAVQALGPLPAVAPVVAVMPTPRPAYVLTELLAKPAPGGGQAYIDQFLKQQTDTTVANAGQ